MAKTYDLIATQTANGSTAAYDFSSISSAFTDLVLVVNGGIASGAQDIWLQVNGDTGTNYSRTNLYGTGTAAGSTRLSTQSKFGMNDAAALDSAYQFMAEFHFMNYSNTTTNKTILERANNAGRGTDLGVHLWRSTAAINAIHIYNSGATNFLSGTTFTLYGIKAA